MVKSRFFVLIVSMTFCISFRAFCQGLCGDKSLKMAGFDLIDEEICLPELAKIINKSSINDVKYIFDYNGESMSDVLANAKSDTSYSYPNIGLPKVYTILQVGEDNGKLAVACRKIMVRSNKSPIFSYTICENDIEFNIPEHQLNNFDNYKIEFYAGINSVTFDKSEIPISIRKTFPLPHTFRISGYFLEESKNCSANSAFQTIPSKSVVTDLPFSPNIDRLELLGLTKLKLDYSGPYSKDIQNFANLYRYEKNMPISSAEKIIENILPGSYELQIPDSTKVYCFFVGKKNFCGSKLIESAEICTHPIYSLKFNPEKYQNEISWGAYPNTFKGINLLLSPFNIFSGFSYWSSQKINVTEANLKTSSFGIPNNSNSYFDKNIDCKKKYCYSISKNIFGTVDFIQFNGVSISNKICLNQSEVEVPASSDVFVTTLKERNNIFLKDNKIWPLNKEKWFLHKKIDGEYLRIDSTISFPLKLVDTLLIEKMETYKASFRDQCNSYSVLGDSVNSIFLKYVKPNNLIWTNKSPFSSEEVNDFSLVYIADSSSVEIVDDNFDFSQTNARADLSRFKRYATYYIKASGSDSSNSNRVTFIVPPAIYLSNVFSPNNDGLNDIFELKGHFSQIVDFKMRIYNRNGELVANLKNVIDTWDGSFRNTKVPSGLYAYRINAVLVDGEEFNKVGAFELLW